MTTFITKLDTTGDGPRLAVKDLIDVEGVPTTAGSRAVERTAKPAAVDAPCLAGARAACARIVGKANLHELAALPLGTNPWFGTPVNPLDGALIPGGSSSGSAVAVATDEADIALGSDTGGSVRVPSACCGTSGLKTTYGRISREGVWPLAPSLDTIGPMARTVDGLVRGMQLLEPGFAIAAGAAKTIGRIRTNSDPRIEAAVDRALAEAEFTVVDVSWDEIALGGDLFAAIYSSELWECNHQLAEDHPGDIGEDVVEMLGLAPIFAAEIDTLSGQLHAWRESVGQLFDQVELLALPTLPLFPPRLDALDPASMLATVIEITSHVAPFNVAGSPCVAQPIRTLDSPIPASLQLVGPHDGEELLLATAANVEAAAST